MEHIHDHPHDHGHVHGGDGHTHDHDHGPHSHAGAGAAEGEKTLAVLGYMLDHNVHHCAELKELAQSLEGEARHLVLHAVEAFDTANDYLARAVAELKK